MPHLTLEYSDNLEVDTKAVFARSHEELVVTGAVNLKGLKSRAVRQREYYMDTDGATCVAQERLDEILEKAEAKLEREAAMREKLLKGEISYDLHGLRRLIQS